MTISAPDGKRALVEINKALITVGRNAKNDVVLPDNSVSRVHALIWHTDENNVFIADQNSTNGVFVNGRRITKEHRLSHKDEIRLGHYELFYEAWDEASDMETLTLSATSMPGIGAQTELRQQGIPADIAEDLRLGDYQLIEEIGRGACGTVYKARDQLGRDVAVKVLTSLREDTATLNAFKREASIVAKLQHPNIVNVYQFGVAGGKPYLAMEYLKGQSLSAIIESRDDLHLAEKLDIILQAINGLKHAHENEIIHRDIKPHNLIVTENFVVKLVDFGIAQGNDAPQMSPAGTLPYMSRQHFTSKRTAWCDVFSMGVVLFELLTGSLPYATERDDWHRARTKIMSSDPAPPLGEFISGYPPDLETVVRKALSKDSRGGYESAADFLFDLSAVQDLVKPQFVSDLLDRLREAIATETNDYADKLIKRTLRLDPQNREARKRQIDLRTLYDPNRAERLAEICRLVESLINQGNFKNAELGIKNGMKIDPSNKALQYLNQRLLEEQCRQKLEAPMQEGAQLAWKNETLRIPIGAAPAGKPSQAVPQFVLPQISSSSASTVFPEICSLLRDGFATCKQLLRLWILG